MKRTISFIVTSLLLSGCATSVWDLRYGSDKPHISYVSLGAGEDRPDKLYVWNPNNNAAYVFQKNGATVGSCLASADVAKARTTENEFKVDLGKVLDKIDSAKVEDKVKIVDTLTKVADRTERATYLNVALFHICMLAGAEKLTNADVRALFEKALERSSTLNAVMPVKPN